MAGETQLDIIKAVFNGIDRLRVTADPVSAAATQAGVWNVNTKDVTEDYYTDIVSPFLKYEGYASPGTSSSSLAWKIKRTSVVGTITFVQYALSGTYLGSWDLRSTYFGAIPFGNSYSIQFDGVNDYINVPHNSSIDFGRLSPFSLSLWAKSSNTATKNYIEKNLTNIGYRLWDSGASKVQLEFRGTGGTADRIRVEQTSSSNINNGNWHNIVCTYSGSGTASGVKIYLDGISSALTVLNDTLITNPTNIGTLSIGARSGGGVNFFGNIDEVSIWGVELSAAGVTELYNAGIPTKLTTHSSNPGLISWWRMGDNDTFPSILDNKSSNNGTMVNMTSGDIETEVP